MQRKQIIDEIGKILSVEQKKLALAKAKNNPDKIKLHEDKVNGLTTLTDKLKSSSNSIALTALTNAISETVQLYPRLPEGMFSEVKKYFNQIAPGWDKAAKQTNVASTNLFTPDRGPENNYNLLKVVICGDTQVGKSATLSCFAEKPHDIRSTIGVEFSTKIYEALKIKLQIWDTAGQERFRAVTACYFRGAAATILMFDITNKETFDHIEKWYQLVLEKEPKTSVILVGNKCDLQSERKVATVEAEAYASEKGIDYMEISDKNPTAVKKLFQTIIDKLAAKLEDTPSQQFVKS